MLNHTGVGKGTAVLELGIVAKWTKFNNKALLEISDEDRKRNAGGLLHSSHGETPPQISILKYSAQVAPG
jgi:hypothetical protein